MQHNSFLQADSDGRDHQALKDGLSQHAMRKFADLRRNSQLKTRVYTCWEIVWINASGECFDTKALKACAEG